MTRRSPEKAHFHPIRFLLLVAFWLLLLASTIVIFLDEDERTTVKLVITSIPNIVAKVRLLFLYADDWNWVTLVFILSLLVIVFSLNDVWGKHLLQKLGRVITTKTWSTGVVWLMRMAFAGTACGIQLLGISFLITVSTANPFIFDSDIPLQGKYSVLLLGTSKTLRSHGGENAYYNARIQAVVELHRRGLVRRIIVSGDKKLEVNYDETRDMRSDLRAAGVDVPILADTSGYRTFDSIEHLRTVGVSDTVIIVSQLFHLERALYLATAAGIPAIGYKAVGAPTRSMLRRELLAKPRVLLDLYIFNTRGYGVKKRARRSVRISNGTDSIILLFVAGSLALAGNLTRNVLSV